VWSQSARHNLRATVGTRAVSRWSEDVLADEERRPRREERPRGRGGRGGGYGGGGRGREKRFSGGGGGGYGDRKRWAGEREWEGRSSGYMERDRGYRPARGRGRGGGGGSSRAGEAWGDEWGSPSRYDDDGEYEEDEYKVAPLRDRLKGNAVWGVEPVRAALLSGRRTIHGLYVQEGMTASGAGKSKGAKMAEWATKRAIALDAPVQRVSKQELNLITENRPHQGVILDTSDLDFVQIAKLPPAEEQPEATLWLALDEVKDPQNFGAVLRSAHFLGAAGVVTCWRNSAPLSAVVSKASAGAMESMEVHACKSMPAFLSACTEGGWDVVGAAGGDGSTPCSDLGPLSRPTVLVLGSEGFGLRATVLQRCVNGTVTVPGGGALLDSLNVSVAAGVLLYALLPPKGSGPAPSTATSTHEE